ncbi:Sulfate Permease (SulP) Family [Phytophthora cinnamomi]|uniref:Sulfate Permease (SulP) Family n=1 Tax=Phytophthora cinnamomi TaxID=4785 RepID=UPI00355AAC8C|nr:Sulfate Permease (SulP) Family [Phytophthora cinnamomi]
MDWLRSLVGGHRAANERYLAPKKTPFELAQHYVPILKWLPNYKIGQDLKFDLVAGITVAMMLIPQEVSLSTIMHVPAHHGLYTAATAPLIYALFGSSTVLSVASGSEVALLTGSILEPIKDEKERVATGIMIAFLSGVILLLVRVLNLSQVADFFSRPVMGGFISAGGLLIMLSQFQNVLGVKFNSQDYPVQTLYQNLKLIGHSNKNALALFDEPSKTNSANDQQQTQGNSADSHGFSITDEQYVGLATARAQADENQAKSLNRKSIDSSQHRSKPVLIAIFLARTLCDLGPLVVCIFGGIVGYSLGPKALKLTGTVPGGFPAPVLPWYGFDDDLISGGRFGTILVNSLTVSLVVFLSSIAMAKRLAIQRGEDINTEQELTGIGAASVVCGIFQAMPPTGGMSRTAVNMQNAHTQLASIVTTLIVIIALYTLTGTLYYLPRATLASIIIVAGYTLVEFKEAKWLFRVKRDEFFVWAASFILTLGLGVLEGLIASIICSVLALMIKTKRSPVVILGELNNGSLVDRNLFPDARHLEGIVVVRVESSLYFANCERVSQAIEREMAYLSKQGSATTGVVLDAYHMNDMDATTIQVLSDTQEKLAVRGVRFVIANAKGHLRDLLSTTNLPARLLGGNPSISVEDAIRLLRAATPSGIKSPSGAEAEHV